MNRWHVLLIVSALVLLPGATCLEQIWPSNPEGGYTPGTGVAGTVGGVGALFGLGWLGTALGAAGTVINAIRNGNSKKALGSVAAGVNAIRDRADKEGKIVLDKETLMDIFARIQDKEGTRAAVRKVVHKIEANGS